jgi:hypothetical protein
MQVGRQQQPQQGQGQGARIAADVYLVHFVWNYLLLLLLLAANSKEAGSSSRSKDMEKVH